MEYENSAGAHGLCHSSPNGKVIVGCFRGDENSLFATTLVHETAHGYIHRYKSSVQIPVWLNEGIADWIANAVVQRTPNITMRQQMAAARLQETRTLGGAFFNARGLDAWQYGAASSIVDLLLRQDNKALRHLIDGIKEGMPWRDSLQRAYGISVNELTTAYGRSIRVSNLTP
jgi:hypothetical protein